MRKAIIDLGTNTFNLLIADVDIAKIEVIHSEKEGVGLGLGGINDNYISEDAFARGFNAIKYFKAVCFALKVEEIKAFGTSALRNASNGADFVKTIAEDLEISLEIISGEKEAQLIFEGVKSSLKSNVAGIIMDIGGGSSEFIAIENQNLIKSGSFEMGVSRIYQKYEFHDPLSIKDQHTIRAYLDKIVGDYFENTTYDTLIGASGSFETFYEMMHHKNFESQEALEVEMEQFLQILDEMIASTLEEREKNSFILPIRKIMGPITAVKIKWFIEKVHCTRLIISPYSLKEGAILTL